MCQALRGQGKQLFLQSFRCARIHADDLRHPRVARREAEPLDILTCAHAHEELARSRRYEVADPMGATTFWGTKDEHFQIPDLLLHSLAPMAWRRSICAMIGAPTPRY